MSNAIVGVRVGLAIAYPLLAHWASLDDSGAVAVVALADLCLIILLQPLAQRRLWAWALLASVVSALWSLRATDVPQLLLLAPPTGFTALLAWWFWRSLRAPRVPLISRIVAELERCPPEELTAQLQRYTRRLTAFWACLLGGLAFANAVLALIAVPDGVLMQMGYPPVLAVSQRAWSWFAHLLNHGIVGAVFIGEYALRRRVLPDRPYRNFADFLRRLGGLDPGFWRRLFD